MYFKKKRKNPPWLCEFAQSWGVLYYYMVAPTSQDRAKAIAEKAQGFLYCVSSLGVTGVRSSFSSNISEIIALAKSAGDVPCAIGFGISTPEQAKEMAKLADGVIVGSAIVKLIAQYGRDSVTVVYDYVKSMKQAVLES